MIQTQFLTHIQILRTDKERDFFNSVLGYYLATQGIVHQSFCVDTPQQNGVAEREIVISSKWLVHCCLLVIFPERGCSNSSLIECPLDSSSIRLLFRLSSKFTQITICYTTFPWEFGCSSFMHIYSLESIWSSSTYQLNFQTRLIPDPKHII